ncbi:hypothetical protein ACIHFC_00625 [Streptomyces sp. NPDC052013]|uniref:hypothetical protein n=1 Tax=Streptomyces sp. NPDC052013 TaxID=3365679 RepID=UPI0037CD6350
MADPVYPLAPDEELPDFETYKAIGTMLLHNSRADESGRFFATCWFMVLLPIFPISRYYVRQTGFREEGNRMITTYEVLGRSRIRWIEIVRTYLAWWVVIPVTFFGPVAMIVVREMEGDDPGFFAVCLAAVPLLLILTLFVIYKLYWRPVREARWAEAATGRTEGRSWQDIATMLQLAVLLGLLGFFVGVAIFFTAMAVGELPTDLDPEPNPFAHTLLHPVTLLAGLPAATGIVTVAVLASRHRR